MKILSWMQSKLTGTGTGRHVTNRKPNSSVPVGHHARQETCKEEFSDWPQGLLAIGTFGASDIKEDSKQNLHHLQENPSSSEDCLEDLPPEEVENLQYELNILLHKQVGSDNATGSDASADHALNKFLHRHPIFEDNRTNADECSDELSNKNSHLQRRTSLVVSRGKDIRTDNASSGINKKSLTFLLKKMFICSGGFTPAPRLRDQVPESRMEKILRAMLHKKIYPQNPNQTASTKKYLEKKHGTRTVDEEQIYEKADDGSKWVKTDSEYIVLEI